MASPRLAPLLLLLHLLARPAAARPACAGQTLALPVACAGEESAASTRFCFSPDLGCLGRGTVLGVAPPVAPFALVGLHVDGFLGSRPIAAADFPVDLAQGEALVADLRVLLPPGGARGALVWTVTSSVAPERHDTPAPSDTGVSCEVDLQVTTPRCAPPDPRHPCSGETCVAGACVPAPDAGTCDAGDPCVAAACDAQRRCTKTPLTGPACDDGDACTTGDRCVTGRCSGTPITCSDGVACTADRCMDGACRHVAMDGRCDSGECVMGSCRPGTPGADRRGCVAVPVAEGEPCTDDGLSCTDDVCTAGACLHVPVDTRCTSGDLCSGAVCAPGRAERDAAGCARGPERVEGDVCAEDGDPCTDDRCRAGRCLHQQVPEWVTCTPVEGAFQKARGLIELTQGLQSAVAGPEIAGGDAGRAVVTALDTRLGRVAGALDAAAAALAGRTAVAATARLPAIAETPAQLRAHIAFTHVLRTPQEVSAFLDAVASARARVQLGRDTSRALGRRGRMLLRGTKTLKGELKRLQYVSQTFAR